MTLWNKSPEWLDEYERRQRRGDAFVIGLTVALMVVFLVGLTYFALHPPLY